MHQKTRPGIDLDDRATLFLQRARDVFGHQVDTGHVQADHARREGPVLLHFDQLRHGAGGPDVLLLVVDRERAAVVGPRGDIGWLYGFNTLGAVVGAVLVLLIYRAIRK